MAVWSKVSKQLTNLRVIFHAQTFCTRLPLRLANVQATQDILSNVSWSIFEGCIPSDDIVDSTRHPINWSDSTHLGVIYPLVI